MKVSMFCHFQDSGTLEARPRVVLFKCHSSPIIYKCDILECSCTYASSTECRKQKVKANLYMYCWSKVKVSYQIYSNYFHFSTGMTERVLNVLCRLTGKHRTQHRKHTAPEHDISQLHLNMSSLVA